VRNELAGFVACGVLGLCLGRRIAQGAANWTDHRELIGAVGRLFSDTVLHAIFLDGVFAPADDGSLDCVALPSLSNSELGELMQVVCTRILGWLERRGVIEARASVSGLAPAGPERRERLPIRRPAAISWAVERVRELFAWKFQIEHTLPFGPSR
jgi:hypothetical protein